MKSLVEFVEGQSPPCGVCKLPDEVRTQAREARSKRITRAQVRVWLATEYGITITEADQMSHDNGRHDAKP